MTRKVLTMNGTFHPKRDVDRLYVSREDKGRGLISCEKCVRGEEFFKGSAARGNGY